MIRKKGNELFIWKEHYIRQGDGKGGWVCKPCEYQFLHKSDGRFVFAFGVVQMDNGELVLVASWNDGDKERPVISRSRDKGDTWNEWQLIPDVPEPSDSSGNRPMMLAYLGMGRLTFVAGGMRYFSNDYGRTWPERIPGQPAANGKPWCAEGNPLIDRDAQGMAVKMAEIGFTFPPDYAVPIPVRGAIRWSNDGGRTWSKEASPDEWKWQVEYDGEVYHRGVSEGSLVRARNGWLVAALRTDMPPRYYADSGKKINVDYDDTLEGTAVSISKDDGKTWSPMRVLYDAGRHHAHLLLMPNRDIVMTMTVRVDVRNERLVSYRRGCDALVSHDNGLSWDMERQYILDEYEFYNGVKWFNGECGHLYSALLDNGFILTAHANYLTKGVTLVRWKP